MKIAGATLNQTPLDWTGNTARAMQAIAVAKKNATDILCFQELCLSGYGCDDLHLSDWLSDQAWLELEKIIPLCEDIVVCIGLPLRIEGKTYNGVAVIHQKEILGITLKQNLALDGVHYEPRWFEAWPPTEVKEIVREDRKVMVGDLIYEAKGIRFGFEICEDAWRIKRPAESLSQRDVDLILNPSASHFAMGKSLLREDLVTQSSLKFNCVYVYVNVLGNEAGRMIYDGDILFANKGKLLKSNKRLSFKPFNFLALDIDFTSAEIPNPPMQEDDKEKNEEFTRAESLALFDYLRKSKARGFVLSLSGGADSSCCAVLVSEMVRRVSNELGWEDFCQKMRIQNTTDVSNAVGQLLTCAYQGTVNSSTTTFNAAQALAQSIGASFHHWNIDEEVQSYTSKIEKALGRNLTWDQDDIALQNIQARTRSPIIWLLANVKQSILLTTSNRSEGDVGYATMDGDTSGSLAPIAGVDKPFILQWLQWAETNLGYKGLNPVNNLQPTAELRPQARTQTDEKDLMPYVVLVDIERLGILHRKPPVFIFQELSKKYNPVELKGHIKKFFRLWAATQWKRERLAPSFHIDDLNVDPRSWCRFPILSGNFERELSLLDD